MQADNPLVPENACRKESTNMDKVNVLSQMAEYDFNSPINVNIIFEDSDDEIDNSFENIQEPENIQTNNNNKETCSDECASECLQVNKNKCKRYCLKTNNKIHKNKTKFEDSNKKILRKIVNNNTNIEKIRKNISHVKDQNNVNKSVSNPHSWVVSNEIREDTESNENTVQTFVEDLLDKLSENLLMIMQSFYYYNLKNKRSGPMRVVDYQKMKKAFHFIKSHFFEISYTTMESVILPLEQNTTLINQFLDNTMMIAKIKFTKWNFQRQHVQALLNELVLWSKQKQEQMKTIKQTPNGNFNLRQHLTRPPPPYPLTNLNNAPNSKTVPAPSSNTQNEMWCIFRSGTPGSQISINVDPDTLLSCTNKRHTNTDEWTGNTNTFASSGEFPTRKTSSENSDDYYHQPSPYLNQNTVHPVQKTIQNPIQNRYNIGQQHQYRQNTGHPIRNYRTHVRYANMNQTPSSESEYINPLRYDCINVNNLTHETEVEQRISSRPVITNVTTFYPMAYRTIRCCMCGKMSEQRYDAYSNSPARPSPSYCSNLCQELDNQVRNAVCNST